MESKFENRIREIRKQKKMSLRQIAEQVEISVPYLSDIERGNRRGSSATIGRIAARTTFAIEFFMMVLLVLLSLV